MNYSYLLVPTNGGMICLKKTKKKTKISDENLIR